jgi:hypothetical protein
MIVILYSNQDRDSIRVLQSIRGNTELRNRVTLVCVDNQDIYNTIRTSTNVDIEEVPCILDVSNESISKYEGNAKVTEYINEMISQLGELKQPKVTDLGSLGFSQEDEIEELETPKKSKTTAEKVAEMQQSRDSFKIERAVGSDNSSPSSINITSIKS